MAQRPAEIVGLARKGRIAPGCDADLVAFAPDAAFVVNDLKHGDGAGRIALWAHVETDAHFGAVTVSGR